MLKISNLKIALSEGKKTIVKDLNLEINPGEIHLLNGKNGSGKSTLVNAIMGNPAFEITHGTVQLINEKYPTHIIEQIDSEFVQEKGELYTISIEQIDANERSLAGIFLANQYPIEIPGVSLTSYLRMIYNARLPKELQLPVFKFKKLLEEKSQIINYPKHLLSRNLNEGFSGGEKKKTEILQMLILEPRYVMLDEIDSGLDKHAVREVFSGLVKFKELYPNSSLIIITHYDRVKEFLTPTFVHEMEKGELV